MDAPGELLATWAPSRVDMLAHTVILEISLHTAAPSMAGNTSQRAWEAEYYGYARAHCPRSTQWWEVAGNEVRLRRPLEFPLVTMWTAALTYCAVGLGDQILFSGPLSPPFPAGIGYMPRLHRLVITLENARDILSAATSRIVCGYGIGFPVRKG